MFEHITFGFCLWDIPAVLLLIVALAAVLRKRRKRS